MKILGNRILVSKVEEEKTEGFNTVEVQDSFVYKGKVELVGELKQKEVKMSAEEQTRAELKFKNDGIIWGAKSDINTNDIVLFAKYSPDTQEIEHQGKKMKIINVDDVLAVL